MSTPTFKPAAPPVINPCQDATGKPIMPGSEVHHVYQPASRFAAAPARAVMECVIVSAIKLDGKIGFTNRGAMVDIPARECFLRLEDAVEHYRSLITNAVRARTDVRA